MTANYVNKLAVFDGTAFQPCPIVSDPSPKSFTSALVIAPGNYLYNGQIFQIVEGLLDFFSIDASLPTPPYNDGGYRIGYAGDVRKLIVSLMWLFQTGPRDNALTVANAINMMRLRKLAMTCGNTTAVVLSILATLGIPSRGAHWVTAGTPTNFDDGHAVVEMKVNGAWAAVDFDLKTVFVKADGSWASVAEIVDIGLANLTCLEIVPPDNYEDDWSATAFRYGAYDHQTFGSVAQRAAWRSRIMNIPALDWPGGIVGGVPVAAATVAWLPSGDEGRSSYISGTCGYTIEPRATINAMFYS